MSDKMKSRVSAEIALIEYLNQYKKEGIEFSIFDENRSSLLDEKWAMQKAGKGGYYVEYTTSSKVEKEMIERFVSRRWKEEQELYIYPDFLRTEIQKAEELAEKAGNEYRYKIRPVVKYLKEALSAKFKKTDIKHPKIEMVGFSEYLNEEGRKLYSSLKENYSADQFMNSDKKRYAFFLLALEALDLLSISKPFETYVTKKEIHSSLVGFLGDVGDRSGLFRNIKSIREDLESAHKVNREDAEEKLDKVIMNIESIINSRS